MAGNLVNNNGTTRTYNAANQMVDDGTNTLTYDANGNLTNDGVNAYTWDRANRMLTAPNSTSYKYDGLSNRIQQTVSSVVTDYLNDVQPGLVKLLRQTEGANVDHFVHAVRGIHSVDDGADWTWYAQDGLGSVRGLVDDAGDVVSSHSYNPMGVPDSDYGAGFGFTGEQTDANDMLYLRARYYAPDMGVFTALDPFEGMHNRPMSLNGYSWVEGNVPNAIDPSGLALIGIWAAAFIEPESIQFIYPTFEVSYYSPYSATPYVLDYNADAVWGGDNRSWYTGEGNIPVSSRVWFRVQVDSNNVDAAISERDTGVTHLSYRHRYAHGEVTETLSGKAPRPNPAQVRCYNDDERFGSLHVHIEANSPNPLIGLSPAIEFEYDIFFNFGFWPGTSVWVSRDRYPWHELYIEVRDDENSIPNVIHLPQEPTGPSNTPNDLFLPAYEDRYEFPEIVIDGCTNTEEQLKMDVEVLNTGCIVF